MNDVEVVSVWSIDPMKKVANGVLGISEHGLPRVTVTPVSVTPTDRNWGRFRPWSFPANWLLVPLKDQPAGELLTAWRTIEGVMNELATWQRRHEGCGREEKQEEEN